MEVVKSTHRKPAGTWALRAMAGALTFSAPPSPFAFRDYAWESFADSIGKVAGFCASATNEQELKACAGAQVRRTFVRCSQALVSAGQTGRGRSHAFLTHHGCSSRRWGLQMPERVAVKGALRVRR